MKDAAAGDPAPVNVVARVEVGGSNPALPKSEREWVRPMSPYAVTKLAAEQYTLAYQQSETQRNLERARAQQAQFDSYVRETASSGGAADEIARAKQLLDTGAINQQEFEAIKQRALAG